MSNLINIDLEISRILAKFENRVAQSYNINGQWKEYTYKECISAAITLMNKMSLNGLKHGDNVFILSRNKPEMLVSYLAIAILGGVAVPVDPRMSVNDLEFIYKHSESRAIVILNEEDEVLAKSISENSLIVHSNYEISNKNNTLINREISLDDIAMIVYTSGTTSKPKGVMISYQNIYFEVDTIINDTYKLTDDLNYLSILPTNHMFEFITGLIIPFVLGGTVNYGNSLLPNDVIKALNDRKVKEMICVPLFLRMLKKGIESKFKSNKYLNIYFKYASRLSSYTNSLFLKKIIFFPLHKSFGGNLRRFICGGASLELEVEDFFWNIGMPVYQGYGLTETSPIISTNSSVPGNYTRGTVGKLIKGVEVRLDESTSEILVKGKNVMKGYFKEEELTRNAIKDGWFHTGDVGHIDEMGNLSIVSRIKDLIVLSNGKKVAPDDVEFQLIKDFPMLKEVCVYGAESENKALKGSQEVCAVIVPSEEYKNKSDDEIRDMFNNKLKQLTDYMRPVKVVIQREDLPKTSTMKTKRAFIKNQLSKIS